jgi:Glycosyl hydrolases family 2, sugar binding domain/Glycosyl hydrolases family 2
MTSFSRRDLLRAGLATSASLATPSPWEQLLSAQPTALDRGGHSGRFTIDLSGLWRFKLDVAREGLSQRWFAGPLPPNEGGPQFIKLPGTTDEASAGIPNLEAPSLSGLYQPNQYAGPAWYQREITIAPEWRGKSIRLFLERTHWITRAWLDGVEVEMQDSLIAPHIHELGANVSPGTHLLTLCVDNTLLFNLGKFVSVYYEGTQTNWNGVVGKIELSARDVVSIGTLQVFPDIDRKLATVKIAIDNFSGAPASGTVHLSVADSAGEVAQEVIVDFSCHGPEMTLEKDVPIGSNPKLWDEFNPNLYSLYASLATRGHTICRDEESVLFGMRKLEIKGTQFILNGRPLLLRGTLECAVFPLTGYPPTDVASWRRIYQIEKSYGLNYIRFHSWTPPQAAFTAADIEGIYIQTEGPQANVPTGEDVERDKFVERELLRIVKTYGNHPSFALMTIGNEFGGSLPVVTRWVDLLIKEDNRHFYSSASSDAMKSENRQFTEDRQMRGVHGPATNFDYVTMMAQEDRPLIGHEIGQWTFFPNLDEIPKYTGVLKARNFEIVQDDLTKKGMRAQARLFLEATGKQAILLYKDEIESIMRTRGYAGFSLLDLHDYPGQGTALVGLLDPFWDSKGLISPSEHMGYAGAMVPLLRFKKCTYSNEETFEGDVDLSNFGPADLNKVEAEWSITDGSGEVMASGAISPAVAPTGTLTRLGSFSAPLSRIVSSKRLKVSVAIPKTGISNSWNIWVYSVAKVYTQSPKVLVSPEWNSGVQAALCEGKRVIVLPENLRAESFLKGSFKPVFWSPIWFKRDPSTMGILVDPDHPLFSGFPTELFSDWQWSSLLEGSKSVILDDTPLGYRPLVQVIDNFSRNHKLGNVFEAKVGAGRLMVCTLNLNRMDRDKQTIEQQSFLDSLYAYVSSESFTPKQELSAQTVNKILTAGA